MLLIILQTRSCLQDSSDGERGWGERTDGARSGPCGSMSGSVAEPLQLDDAPMLASAAHLYAEILALSLTAFLLQRSGSKLLYRVPSDQVFYPNARAL